MNKNDDEIETAIESTLGGNPRASEIDGMIGALRDRMRSYQTEADHEKDPVRKQALETRIEEYREQIGALMQEMAISAFVESSVRVSANRPRLDFDPDEIGDLD